jgi:signal transduction histidine kinase
LHGTLEAVVEITKLDANKIPVEKKIFDVTNVLTLVSQAFKTSFEKRGIEFNLKFTGLEKRKAYTDENLLRRVLSIIVENASKFTTSGIVEIAVSNPDLNYSRLQGLFVGPKEVETNFMMFKISDTGTGVKEEDLNLIFDEYSIIEKTRKNIGENIGTGLNLPIAKKIVDILGGIIWVESELHKGSSFNFIIPVKSEGQETAVNE